MSRPGRLVFTWIAASLVGAAVAGPARSAEPTRQELMDKIEALQARIDRLESRQNQVPQISGAAVEATVDAILRDSQRRSASLAETGGFLGGWDEGFWIRSADGNFAMHPWLQMQFRGVVNSRQDGKGQGQDNQNGFEVRRMYFGFEGHVYSPDLRYSFLWATNRHTGEPALLVAWVGYHLPNTPWTIRGGQIQNPLDHEAMVFARWQVPCERSLPADALAGQDGYVQGVQLAYDDSKHLRASFAITDGFGSTDKNFEDFPVNKTNYGFAGRVEYKPFGDWIAYRDFTARGTKTDLLVFGAAADYTEAGHRGALRHVADMVWETTTGLSVYAAYLGRLTLRGGSDGSDTYDPTFRFLVAKTLGKNWEIFARYDFLQFDSKQLPPGVHNAVHEITAGVNYYLHDHHAKFTLDVVYLPNGTFIADDASSVLSTGAPVAGSPFTLGGGCELIGRFQFQLFF